MTGRLWLIENGKGKILTDSHGQVRLIFGTRKAAVRCKREMQMLWGHLVGSPYRVIVFQRTADKP